MYKFIAIACIALSVIIISCKSSSNNNLVDNSVNNAISATIADSSFSVSGKTVSGQYYDTSVFKVVVLYGLSSTSATPSMEIILEGFDLSIKKYNIVDTGAVTAAIFYVPNGGAPISAKSGSVVLSKVTDTHIVGTFTCILTDGTTITNGKLNIIY